VVNYAGTLHNKRLKKGDAEVLEALRKSVRTQLWRSKFKEKEVNLQI